MPPYLGVSITLDVRFTVDAHVAEIKYQLHYETFPFAT